MLWGVLPYTSSLCPTAPPPPHPADKAAGWDTRPSKATSPIRCVGTVVATNTPSLRMWPAVSLSIVARTSSGLLGALGLPPRGPEGPEFSWVGDGPTDTLTRETIGRNPDTQRVSRPVPKHRERRGLPPAAA